MSNSIIRVKIDVKKLLKEHFFQGKTGSLYCDLALLESQNDKYGNDYFVIQEVSKEARERGERGPIVGNGKVFTFSGGNANRQQASQRPAPSAAPTGGNMDDEDVPF